MNQSMRLSKSVQELEAKGIEQIKDLLASSQKSRNRAYAKSTSKPHSRPPPPMLRRPEVASVPPTPLNAREVASTLPKAQEAPPTPLKSREVSSTPVKSREVLTTPVKTQEAFRQKGDGFDAFPTLLLTPHTPQHAPKPQHEQCQPKPQQEQCQPKPQHKQRAPISFSLNVREYHPSEETERALKTLEGVRNAYKEGSVRLQAGIQRSVLESIRGIQAAGVPVDQVSCVPVSKPSVSWREVCCFTRYSHSKLHFVVPTRRRRLSTGPSSRQRLAKYSMWECSSTHTQSERKNEAEFYRKAYSVLKKKGFKLPFTLPTDPVQMATLLCVMTDFVQTLLKQKRNQWK